MKRLVIALPVIVAIALIATVCVTAYQHRNDRVTTTAGPVAQSAQDKAAQDKAAQDKATQDEAAQDYVAFYVAFFKMSVLKEDAINSFEDPQYLPAGTHWGFSSVEEAKKASLGTPMVYMHMDYPAVKSWHPGTDPTTLLIDNKELVYPVCSGNKVCNTVTIGFFKGRWSGVRTGGIGASALGKIRFDLVNSTGLSEDSFFLLSGKYVTTDFIGYFDKKGQLYLTPLSYTGPPLHRTVFTAGKTLIAEDVIKELQRAAK